MIGTTLAHYTITGHLGTGGMGEVYEATDAKLGRRIAVKLLPEAFTNDPERAVRFEREARVLASLNHPNIAAIYGIEQHDGRTFLVMELVPGETLAERIARGPLPIPEALDIATQIAEALQAAHDSERAIVHRDLKPANVKITPDGTVKVLDFGLAKAYDPQPADENPANSPTISVAATMQGVILGTAAYMSPEQARGRTVDQRADMWAFGVVLFEMLSGRSLFAAETVGDSLAAVLREEIPWGSLPADTPPGVVRLLRRCLNRDPRHRLRSAADARIELDEALTGTEAKTSAVASAPPTPASRIPWVLTGLLALALLGTWSRAWFVPEPPAPITRTKIELSPNEPLGTLFGTNAALSPDGQTVAFVTDSGGQTRLHVRRLDRLDATPLSGTDDARSPFFSPDGRWIGYQTTTSLMKVGVEGGAPIPIAETGANPGRGGTWNGDTIVFSRLDTGLLQISADGGEPTPLTTLNQSAEERTHRWPSFLPGERRSCS